MSVTFTASTLGPTASSFSLTSSSGVTGSGASSPLTLQEAVEGTYTYSVSGVNANGTGPSSAASNSVVVASVFAPSGAYDSIATVTVGGAGAATIDFTSIPSTYKHLQIRGIGRTARAAVDDGLYIRFNSDSGGNYVAHSLVGNGTTASSFLATSVTDTEIETYWMPGNNASASIFGTAVMDILDYADTNKYTVLRSLGGNDRNGSGYLGLASGLWKNTAAVTSITLIAGNSTWLQYSSFALYGIKGA